MEQMYHFHTLWIKKGSKIFMSATTCFVDKYIETNTRRKSYKFEIDSDFSHIKSLSFL